MDAVDHVPHRAVGDLEYRLLLKLANVAAQDGSRAWRNMHEVAAELGVSLRSIRRAIKALEDERLIMRGDQHYVDHIRGDRRPVVYDLNMDKMLNWDQYHGLDFVTLDGVTHGVTEISTETLDTPHGVTHGVTAAVPHREQRELSTKTKKVTQGSARARECPVSERVSPSGLHDFTPGGVCVNCAYEARELVSA